MAQLDNDFTDLLKKLKDGRLTRRQVEIAYRASIEESTEVPEAIKSLLCGKEGHRGLLQDVFHLAGEISGKMELAFQRGRAQGHKEAVEELKKDIKKELDDIKAD